MNPTKLLFTEMHLFFRGVYGDVQHKNLKVILCNRFILRVLRQCASCSANIGGASLKMVLTEYHCRFGRRKAPVFLLGKNFALKILK